MNNLDLEIQTLDEKRQMRNLANAVRLADSFSLLFVRCNQRPRQKEIIEELRGELAGYQIKVIFLENQIEHLLDELQARLGDEKPDAIFVYGLESSFPKADEAAESKFVVTLNHSRNSFKRVLDCPLVLFIPEYALSAIYHGATDFYSIRSGVYLFSAKAEETEQLISMHTSREFIELEGLLLEERENRIKTIEQLLVEYQSLPDLQRNLHKENRFRAKLAELYYISGQYTEAASIYQEIMKYAQASEEIDLLGDILNSLAMIYDAQHKYTEAIELYKKAIKIAEDTIGTKHYNYATRLNNLALAYQSQGKPEEAIKLYEKVIDIDKETIGTNHPHHANVLNNLAITYQSQGKNDEAIKLFKESLSIVEKTVGKKHLEYANRLSNISALYVEQGKYQKALRMLKEAYQISLNTLGKKHYCTTYIKTYIEICRAKIKKKSSPIIPYKN